MIAKLTTIRFLLTFVSCLVFLAPSSQASDVAWTVKDTMQDTVADFMKASPIAAEMRREGEPSLSVRILEQGAPGLVMSDDLVACLHLSNQNNDMVIDSGGGFDIYLKQVSFPGGKWDVHVRIREFECIDELDKTTILVLDKLIIGALRFRDSQILTNALRLLTNACFESGVGQN